MIATAPLWLCWMVPVAIFGGMDANPTLFVYDWIKKSSNCRSTYFRNKRIWITGASSGIGAELARQFHQHGAHLILSSRKEESLLQLQTSLLQKQKHDDEYQNSIQILPLDVTMSHDEEWNEIFQNVNVDDIDIVILNAGLGQLSPAEQDLTSEKENRQIMEVNYWGPVQMTQRLLQQQQKSSTNKKNLHIVVTSSVAAKMAVPLSSTYAASKHALHGYFKSLQSEVAANNHHNTIRIDLPCPGPVDTNFHQNILQPNKNNDLTTTTTTTTTKSSSKSKMPPQRCAQLIIASIMGPSILMHETWISRQPTLFFTYLSQYAPGLATLLLNQIGKLRLRAHKSGLPLYELSTWFKVAFQYKQISENSDETD